MVKVIDNFFDQSDYLKILADSKVNWTININNTVYKDLKEDFYVNKCIKIMSEKIKKPVNLYRAYSHALRSNEPCNIHEDGPNSTHTALLFVNNIYSEDWMGGTVVWDPEPQYFQFKPNRMVIFKASLLHTGIMFRNTDNYRIQCVWKISIDE